MPPEVQACRNLDLSDSTSEAIWCEPEHMWVKLCGRNRPHANGTRFRGQIGTHSLSLSLSRCDLTVDSTVHFLVAHRSQKCAEKLILDGLLNMCNLSRLSNHCSMTITSGPDCGFRSGGGGGGGDGGGGSGADPICGGGGGGGGGGSASDGSMEPAAPNG